MSNQNDYNPDSEPEAPAPTLLPANKYRGRGVEGMFAETAAGHDQIALSFELLDVPGRTLTYYGSFSEKGTPHTMKAFRAMGWKGTDITEFQGPLAGIADGEVSLDVIVQEYPEGSGNFSNKIAWVNSQGGIAVKTPLDAGRVAALAARMKGYAINSLGGAPAGAKGAPPAPRPNTSRLGAPVHPPGKDPWKGAPAGGPSNDHLKRVAAGAPVQDSDLPY